MTKLSSASKHSLYLRRHFITPRFSSSLLRRHFSTETPPGSTTGHTVIDQTVKHLLETPQSEWAPLSNQLSSKALLQVTRRLGSSATALQFYQFLESNSLSHPLAFQAVLELASREPDANVKLLELYDELKARNVDITINAATLLIGRFAKLGMVEKSVSLYEELDPLKRNVNVRNVYIDVLLGAHRVGDARKVLDEMLERDSGCPPNEFTWSIVWRRLESDDEIVALVAKSGKHGVFPGSTWIMRFLTKLCKDNATDKAWDFLHELMEMGAPLETCCCNVLLSKLGRSRDLDKLNKLMATMKEKGIEPDIVTFGILMNHLCKARRVDAALEVLENLRSGEDSDGIAILPDVIMYNSLIDGLCKVGREDEALTLMEQMRAQTECEPNNITYNCLIDGYCKSGKLEKAQELYNQMKSEMVKPNVVTVNSLLDGLCRHGRINSAVEFLDEMKRSGIKGDAVTYSILITAFCSVNNIDKAMELFNEMVNIGCSADAKLYYSLINGLSWAGRMDDAISIFLKLKEAGFSPDVVCYNVLIGGFCKRNKLARAIELLKELENSGLKPDVITYNSLISRFCKSGNFKVAHKILRKMMVENLGPTVVTFGALIHAYCIHGKLDEAMKIYKLMVSKSKVPPNDVIYNILIDALCKNNNVELALSLMEDMYVHGVKPNINTYNAMFKGLHEKNWLDKAFKLMDRMIMQACKPNYITMEILEGWLSAAGETKKLRIFAEGYEVSESASAA